MQKIRKSRRTIFRRIFKPGWLYLLSRSLKPLSHNFGSNRGEPIDRYYIEKFLSENKGLIKGACLEIDDNFYTKKFGDNILKSDVLDINKNNDKANIRADLRNAPEINDHEYDCIILTQVLQFIDEYESTIKECRRILKPGGTLLATLPSISRIDVRAGTKGDYWRFTHASAEFIFSKFFDKNSLEIKSRGNVLVGTAFWVGMAREELSLKKLDYNDPDFPVIITVRAKNSIFEHA